MPRAGSAAKKATTTRKRVSKAAPTTSASLVGEIGGTGLQQYSGIINEEFLNQLKGVRRYRVFREMSENDPIVGAVLYAIEMLLRGVKWTVEPGGDAPEDEQAVEFLESLLGDMSHTMDDFIGEWMAAPIYGYAPFEIVLKYRRGENIQPGLASQYDDGKLGVRKLAIRHPDTLERWIFDDAGGIQGFVQRTAPKWESASLPIERMLLFRTLARKGNPEGQSLLRRSYVPYYLKKRLVGIEVVGIERNMAGFPVMYYPSEWQSDAYSAQLTDVKQVVQRIKVDDQAGLALPSLFDEQGNQLLKFELVAASGKQQGDISPIIERYDRRIAMTMLADVILLGHEKVGSFALADSKTNLFTVGLGALLDDIGATFSRHLIPRLLRYNGMKVTKMPTFQHSDLETVDLTAVGDYIMKLANAGAPLFPSEEGKLERHLYRVAGLPEPEGDFPLPTPRIDPFAEPDDEPDDEPDNEDEDDENDDDNADD